MAQIHSSLPQDENTCTPEPKRRLSRTEPDDTSFYGLEAIDRALHNIYPNKPNTTYSEPHLISTPMKKKWCGGKFPLDFIKIFYYDGHEEPNTAPHWHYVTYGFSDLHGDGRVHEFKGRGCESGFGFELTFRVVKGDEDEPPMWPINILNDLSLYIFGSGFGLDEYDHISWPCPLEQAACRGSISNVQSMTQDSSPMRHIIVVEDITMPNLDTPNGSVLFLQLVGIMKEEFRYARAFKTRSIIDQLLDHPQVGAMMVTDVRRKTSVFDLNPMYRAQVIRDIEEKGMVLGDVASCVSWKEISENETDGLVESMPKLTLTEEHDSVGQWRPVCNVYLEFDAAAAELLYLMIRGRLLRDRTFVFRSPEFSASGCKQVIEFIPYTSDDDKNQDSSEYTLNSVNDEENHLQIYCNQLLMMEMLDKFACLENVTDELEILPKEIQIVHPGRTITFYIHPEPFIYKPVKSKESPLAGH